MEYKTYRDIQRTHHGNCLILKILSPVSLIVWYLGKNVGQVFVQYIDVVIAVVADDDVDLEMRERDQLLVICQMLLDALQSNIIVSQLSLHNSSTYKYKYSIFFYFNFK